METYEIGAILVSFFVLFFGTYAPIPVQYADFMDE